MYIGAKPNIANYTMLDNLTASATATYNLTKDGVAFFPENPLGVITSLNGVIQKAGSSFNIVNNTIVFSQALTSNDSIDFILVMAQKIDLNTPADASVTNAKTNFVSTSSNAGLQIKGDGTTDGTLQLNCSQNSHGIKIKSPPHSASASYTLTMPNNDGSSGEALTTDGSGVLSWASVGGTNTPSFHANNTSNPTWSYNTHTKVAFTNENFDTNSAYDTSTSRFTVPSGKGGKYYIGSTLQLYGSADFSEMFARIYVNGSAENQLSLRIRYKDADPLDGGYNQNYYFGGIKSLSATDYIEVYAMVNMASGNAVINQQSTFFAYKLID